MTKSERSAGSEQGRALVRCAVYTRKSSEEGLEQEFNSLHAQREACEAYIRSQKHQGWVVLPAQFDDGGISGGTMDRPALQLLLAEIRARGVDTVVVYKVDRLTRSLADFAKIVEIFDGHGVAFVSVTQHFNTTTSMGRLTLNVLLSFAQFEREVAGERVRDKIAASKRLGMWMGGTLPLGYDVHDRKLVVNEPEAESVRHIFRRYLALRSVRALQEELERDGITSKQRVSTSGRSWGGQPFGRGALYILLQNRIYLGEIVHKDRHYPGQHAPIVDKPLWDEVQALLAVNAAERRAGHSAKQPSLLAGLIHDGQDHRMTPTHAVKAGKRYRYYISRSLVTGIRAKAAGGFRIPAPEVEQVVCARMRAWLADAGAVLEASAALGSETGQQRELIGQAAELAQAWPDLPNHQQRQILRRLLTRVEVGDESVALHVTPGRLGALLSDWRNDPNGSDCHDQAEASTLILSVPVRLQRIEKNGRLLVHASGAGAGQPNEPLIRLLVRAHKVQLALLEGKNSSLEEVVNRTGLGRKHALSALRLSWLAPDITQAILRGCQPASLTADKLARMSHVPVDWHAQRLVLGFA